MADSRISTGVPGHPTATVGGIAAPVTVGVNGVGGIVGSTTTLGVYTSAARAENATGDQFSTDGITYVALDITGTSFTGGTAPTVTFRLDRLGADGVWYSVYNSTPQSTLPVTISVDISPDAATGGTTPRFTEHGIFTGTARFRWVFGGTANPTAVTFSASIIGR